MAKLTKKRKAALEKINSEMAYEVDVALGLVKEHAIANFPESVDVQSLDSDTVFTFKNKKALGYRRDESAAELFLFDPELERAKNVKAAEADARKYKQLKTSLVALDVVLVVAGARNSS